MRTYEGLFLFDSRLASKEWDQLKEKVEAVLAKHGANLLYSEKWQERKLAYEIDYIRKGVYLLTYFEAPPEAITPMRRDLKIAENIVRELILAEPEAARKIEELQSPPGAEGAAESEGEGEGEGKEADAPAKKVEVSS